MKIHSSIMWSATEPSGLFGLTKSGSQRAHRVSSGEDVRIGLAQSHQQ
jgi:hypothetical protein